MPLVLTVPAAELYDESSSRFLYTPKTVLTLEHSLLSVSKWEAKWHKPYLYQTVMIESVQKKTAEEERDYIRCMTITGHVDPNVYRALSVPDRKKISEYINNPMTATTINKVSKKPNREIVTNELIYYWMTALNIPFDPCERWHLNHLLSLIEVCALKQETPEKMPTAAALKRSHSINAARRAAYSKHRR